VATDGDAGKPASKPRRKPTPRKAAPARKPSTAKPVAWDDHPPAAAHPSGNGHKGWVDYIAPTTSWDPWQEASDAVVGDGDADARGLNRTLGEWLEAVVPPEAQIHFFNAGREFAAGIQTTLDHHINRRDEDGGGGAEALRIEIE